MVNIILRDGKKARAQRMVLDSLKILEKKEDITDAKAMLYDAIERAAPLLAIRATKRHAKVIHVPTPLRINQRRHRAVKWILEAARKRPEKSLEERLAGELYDIHKGTSSVLERRAQVHKQALANRANALVQY